MKWDEFQKYFPDISNKELTEIECPKCGKHIWRRTDIVLTTYPPQYVYECECGWSGTAYV